MTAANDHDRVFIDGEEMLIKEVAAPVAGEGFRTAPMKDGIRYNSRGEPIEGSEPGTGTTSRMTSRTEGSGAFGLAASSIPRASTAPNQSAPVAGGLDENPCCYSLHEFEQVCPRTGTTFLAASQPVAEEEE